MKRDLTFQLAFIVLLAVLVASCSSAVQDQSQKIVLKEGWFIQSSQKVTASGAALSSPAANVSSWYKASVPSTVMGTLTQNGLYADIFTGDNFKLIDKEPFNASWWYRKEFDLSALGDQQHAHLQFDGISYYANIWLNGKQIASKDSIFGSFRRFDFDVTDLLKESNNVLAVEVFRQQPGDFGIGFADWNPRPPDKNMGIWRPVTLNITGAVAIHNPTVESDVNTETLAEASLTLKADLTNYSDKPVTGKLKGKIDSVSFEYPVNLNAHETKHVQLTAKDLEALHVKNPKLWWCNTMGKPELYRLQLSFEEGHTISDKYDLHFGIREVEDYLTKEGYRGYKLNGKKVLIKGAGWTDDIFLRDTDQSNETQIRYVKDMNLNTIRLENIWGTSQNIYDLCDAYGILVMTGWSCQWEWDNYLGKACDDYGGIQTPPEMKLIATSLGDQIKWLRFHPSIIAWFVGSDKLPKPELEKNYQQLIKQLDNRPYLAAASARNSTVSGPTGVKMNGPYEYEGPNYWYLDSINGGAFGFNTETGPGPQLPVKESILKMIPKDKLWPLNDTWNYHCTTAEEAFNKLDVFNAAVESRYGKAKDLDDYILKASVNEYEAIRPMFEAFRINQHKTTGIVQWMLNSAWPSFYWQLYDYYLLPTPAYYAVRKANEPLQLMYNYKDGGVYLVNETYADLTDVKATVQLYTLDSKKILDKQITANIAQSKSEKIFTVDKVKGVEFLALELRDAKNTVIATNFYWLSSKEDEYAWSKTTWAYTPMKSYADFKSLNTLEKHAVKMTFTTTEKDGNVVLDIALANTNQIAFFTSLSVVDEKGIQLRPVFYSDNYVSILPNETKHITCSIEKKLLTAHSSIVLAGWNIDTTQLALN